MNDDKTPLEGKVGSQTQVTDDEFDFEFPSIFDLSPEEKQANIERFSENTLEEPKKTEKQETNSYKTSPALLKAVRKYEDNIKQDKELLERRNHQKNYSGAKSFITYAASIAELQEMKVLINLVLDWAKDVDDFDQLKRPERKERYRTRHLSKEGETP